MSTTREDENRDCGGSKGLRGGEFGEGGSAEVATAGRESGQLESELENVCRELGLVENKVAELLAQQTSLCNRRDQLSAELQARKKRREFISV